jgi:serine/threonine protein kinase
VLGLREMVVNYDGAECALRRMCPYALTRLSRAGCRTIRRWSWELLVQVAALHAAGWYHGDPKPPNLCVDECGRLRLIDFGSAGRLDDANAYIACTVTHQAPELRPRLGPIDAAKCDSWACGKTLLEIATGWLRSMPAGETAAALERFEGSGEWDESSRGEFVDLLRQLLMEDWRMRGDVEALLEHGFVAGCRPGESEDLDLEWRDSSSPPSSAAGGDGQGSVLPAAAREWLRRRFEEVT